MTIIQKLINRISSNNPTLPRSIDEDLLIKQASRFFSLPIENIREEFEEYKTFSIEMGYAQRLGERKTLSFEEAFLILLSIQRTNPINIVEIGTQFGKSTRRILDIIDKLELSCQVTCFDISNEIIYIDPSEINLQIHDLTHDFRKTVLERLKPDLIYLDAHPFNLLHSVISNFLDWSQESRSILAVHDCSVRLYRSQMALTRDDLYLITSKTGLWERHVLGEVFKTPAMIMDSVETSTHRLKIFETPHGLALIAPLQLLDHR